MTVGDGGNGVVGDSNASANVLQPHPVKEQLPGIQYCVNSPPPWLEALLLGFQHYILTLGMTIMIPSLIVPQMGGGKLEKALVIQTMLFVTGLSTLLQSLFGTRLPTVINSSYSFVIPTTSIVLADRYRSFADPQKRFEQTMRGIQGALLVSSCLPIIMGFTGIWRNVVRFLSPLSVVPLVTYTGIGLYQLGFPKLAECVEVGLPELIIMVFISQYRPRFLKSEKAKFDRYSVLCSTAIVWAYAAILTSTGVYNNKLPKTQLSCRTDQSGLIGQAPWIYIPYPFQWGMPTFNPGEAFAMMAASFVALIESTGTFIATSRYASATPVPPSVLGRGTGWLGMGVLLDSLFGSVAGSSASVENAGLLALTKVGSRRVTQISAAFMIFFSICGKFGAVFASIPLPIVAASYCILCGYVSSAGLSFLQFCNLNSFRTKFIIGFSLFMGISIPQYFNGYQISARPGPLHTHTKWFNNLLEIIFMSNATVAAIIALLLDQTLDCKAEATPKDNGLQWWEKFNLYKSDVRTDEFYALPCRLNQLFPSF
ncbi:nucleobase-ascorbate transporter 7-like [Malania oleifera]|uniref:nucleobase-ascorbate transporter 7-like n=1 Tax=Malania oleifera TaxID=397392 RepID=UPI0025AE928B|nr:nucleobase-ascorbate transporter 7-like [Malania oleifera]